MLTLKIEKIEFLYRLYLSRTQNSLAKKKFCLEGRNSQLKVIENRERETEFQDSGINSTFSVVGETE